MSGIDHYQVVGNPIAQSKSPQIHAAFAAQTGQAISYGRACPSLDGFRAAALGFFAGGGKGMNITAPFKLEAYALADVLSERARLAGAVNTLALQADGSLFGDNTDGIGLVTDLCGNLGWPLRDRKVLVLGAGGAVRGILQPLLEQAPALLLVANRTPERALKLANLFAGYGAIAACDYAALAGRAERPFDLIINGTSASLSGDLPPLPDHVVVRDGYAYDLSYAAQPTAFLRWAQQQPIAHRADGLGMLVGQAAEAFRLWRGVAPDVAPVLAALRAELAASR